MANLSACSRDARQRLGHVAGRAPRVRDRLEGAAHLLGGVRLGVEGVALVRPADLEEHDARLGGRLPRRRGRLFRREEIAEAAEETHPAELQQAAPRQAEGLARVGTGGRGFHEHE